MQIKYFKVVGGAFVLLATVSNFYASEFSDAKTFEEEKCRMCLQKITDARNTKFDQDEVNRMLLSAAGNDDQVAVDLLLNFPEELLRPNQEGVNWALSEAVRKNNQLMVELMINREEGELRPDQQGINSALCKATRNNNRKMVENLLNREEGELRPDQHGVNLAVSVAALHGYTQQLEWFFNGEKDGRICPNQDGINRAYRAALSGKQYEIADLLKPHVRVKVDHKK
jgi:hypothetical protein